MRIFMLLKKYFMSICKYYLKPIILCFLLFIVILFVIKLTHLNNHNINTNKQAYKKIFSIEPTKSTFSNIVYNNKIGVPILEYHMIAPLSDTINFPPNMVITPEELDEQLHYLKDNGYVTITYDDLYNFMKFKDSIPEKSFIISFDDGYESNYIYLPKILRKYDMKAAIAVVTGKRLLKGNVTPLNWYFTWEQAKEMQDSGYINIESHTTHHVNLDNSVDLKTELLGSKNDIMNYIGRQTKVIVYPEGYFDKEVLTKAQEYGYLMGITIQQGINYYNDNPFKIKRIMVSSWNTGKSIMNKINRYKKFNQKIQ